MDEIDDAQRAERLFREGALTARGKVGRAGHVSLERCVDCGEIIPEKRRLAVEGCERCMECQEELEGDRSCRRW